LEFYFQAIGIFSQTAIRKTEQSEEFKKRTKSESKSSPPLILPSLSYRKERRAFPSFSMLCKNMNGRVWMKKSAAKKLFVEGIFAAEKSLCRMFLRL